MEDRPVKKPNAVPPKTRHIKMKDGGTAIKKRPEDLQERFERLHHLHDDGPKPKHFDDKSIIDQEEWRGMTPLQKKTPIIERPKPFNNMDKSTYPSNQKKQMNTWQVMMELAKKPKDKDDLRLAKEMRQTISKYYNDPKVRNTLGDDELKLIGKHKSQIKPIVSKPIPKLDPNYKPFRPEPTKSLEEYMAEKQKERKSRYGINENLVTERMAVKKMTDWVLGDKKEERYESKDNKNSEDNDD